MDIRENMNLGVEVSGKVERGWPMTKSIRNLILSLRPCRQPLLFGSLGEDRAMQGQMEAQEGIPWGPGLDVDRFWLNFGTAF